MARHGIFFVICAILLVGCSRLSRENYDKLRVGMEYKEVVAILGKPDTCSDTLVAKSCTWGNERKYITINFIGDKVILYLSKNLK